MVIQPIRANDTAAVIRPTAIIIIQKQLTISNDQERGKEEVYQSKTVIGNGIIINEIITRIHRLVIVCPTSRYFEQSSGDIDKDSGVNPYRKIVEYNEMNHKLP